MSVQWRDIFNIINMDDDHLLDYLQSKELVRSQLRCRRRSCRRRCTLQSRTTAALGKCFRCPKCRTAYSVLMGSFFSNMKMPIRNVLLLMWLWVAEVRAGCAAMVVSMRKGSVIQLYRFLRDICSWELVRRENWFLFGGPDSIVQINEYKLTKQKCNVGPPMTREQWVLGIYDMTARKGHIMYIPNRDRSTLEDKISKFVRPGSVIWTDCSTGYKRLRDLGYIHQTVDHSKNFVDPETGVSTNHIGGYWSRLKGFLRRLGAMRSVYLPEYVDQFMWWEICGPTAAARFDNLLRQIAAKHSF